jgi:MoxR-like ATPase
MDASIKELNERVQQESSFVEEVLAEVRKVIVGQETMVERVLIGLLASGHVLLEGVPGLAKTTALKTIAQSLAVKFQRIQFTPDLLPADVIGTLIYNQKTSEFTPRKGPIFTNLLLADEVNRAPAKVQSALLEAMQERQVTIGDVTYRLEEPFLVLATQNPIEQEGTYPLPEAQVDRFMLKVKVSYPSRDEEKAILNVTSAPAVAVKPVLQPETLLSARRLVNSLWLDEKLKDYIVDLVRATRDPAAWGMKDLKGFVEIGASPRASISLAAAAKAHAFLRHRGFVTPDDIKALGADVLRHRVVLSYEAEAERVTADDIVKRVFEAVPVP